jgi:hypothetical protein
MGSSAISGGLIQLLITPFAEDSCDSAWEIGAMLSPERMDVKSRVDNF